MADRQADIAVMEERVELVKTLILGAVVAAC
jgi:hypothetical protein